jgi:hypothetical protein
MDPAAAKAAANALRQFVTEDFTLFSVGLLVTITRTYARVKQVGFKGLQGDDYLVWLAMVCSVISCVWCSTEIFDFLQIIYAAETTLAYSVGAVARGLANNGMTDEQRMTLNSNSPEFQTRYVNMLICRLSSQLKPSLVE